MLIFFYLLHQYRDSLSNQVTTAINCLDLDLKYGFGFVKLLRLSREGLRSCIARLIIVIFLSHIFLSSVVNKIKLTGFNRPRWMLYQKEHWQKIKICNSSCYTDDELTSD